MRENTGHFGMRLAVVGSVLVDTIHGADDKVIESLGGIAHTVAALSALVPRDTTVQPICRVGDDLWPHINETWGSLPSTSLAGLVHEAADNPRNRLIYRVGAPQERREQLSHVFAPLAEAELEMAHDADAVLVNCITGNDCTLTALENLGRHCANLYLDVHSLALGRHPDGTRFYRRPDGWQRWVASADVVQCNRAEAATLAGIDRAREPDAEAERFLRDQLRDAAERPASRPRAIVVTKASEGATVYWRRGSREAEVRSAHVPAQEVVVADPTGAGDAFGAGYMVAWLNGTSTTDAARAGVRAGTAACTLDGVAEAARFREAVRRLPENTRRAGETRPSLGSSV